MYRRAGDGRCVCPRLESAAGVRSSARGGDGSTWRRQIRVTNLHRRRARTECGDPERDSQTHRDPEVQEVWPLQGKVHLAGQTGPDRCHGSRFSQHLLTKGSCLLRVAATSVPTSYALLAQLNIVLLQHEKQLLCLYNIS
jgi:hypothetical protein